MKIKIGDRIKVMVSLKYSGFLRGNDTWTEDLWGEVLKIDNKTNECLIEWEEAPFSEDRTWEKIRNILERKIEIKNDKP